MSSRVQKTFSLLVAFIVTALSILAATSFLQEELHVLSVRKAIVPIGLRMSHASVSFTAAEFPIGYGLWVILLALGLICFAGLAILMGACVISFLLQRKISPGLFRSGIFRIWCFSSIALCVVGCLMPIVMAVWGFISW